MHGILKIQKNTHPLLRLVQARFLKIKNNSRYRYDIRDTLYEYKDERAKSKSKAAMKIPR